jgi:hypothetical protein
VDDHLATIWESIADRLSGEIALVHGTRRTPPLRPDELFATIAATRPRTVSTAGDAFARPMTRALDRRAAAGKLTGRASQLLASAHP